MGAADRCGAGFVGFGGNCEILFFILVFLLLFWNCRGVGIVDP